MVDFTIKKSFTKEYLSQCIVYGKRTGTITWLFRPRSHFTSISSFNTWNEKNAGEIATKENANGYQAIYLDGRTILAHHAAFILVNNEKPTEVDHINGIRSDNRWENIRTVTRLENTKNRKVRSDSVSGICGVQQRSDSGRWRAKITHNGKRINLGQFDTKEQAIDARKKAEIEFGYHENHGRN